MNIFSFIHIHAFVSGFLHACQHLLDCLSSHMHPLKELVTFTSVYWVLLHGTLLGRIPHKMEVFLLNLVFKYLVFTLEH